MVRVRRHRGFLRSLQSGGFSFVLKQRPLAKLSLHFPPADPPLRRGCVLFPKLSLRVTGGPALYLTQSRGRRGVTLSLSRPLPLRLPTLATKSDSIRQV